MSKIGDSSTFQKLINMIKTALSGKANSSHTHTKSQITDFPSSMPASDVYSWAKASTKPSYAYSELSGRPTLGTAAAKDVPSSGNASASQVVMGNDSRLSNSRPASDVYSWAKASTKPSYTASEVGAAASSHSHSAATTSAAGFMSSADKTKLNGIESGAQVNTNTFGYIRVGGSGAGNANSIDCSNSTWNFELKSSTKNILVRAPGLGCLNYAGNAYVPVQASAFTVSSSIKTKKNIEDMTEEEALKLFLLRPVKYDYINEGNGTNCYGMIAEEVMEAEINYPVTVMNDEDLGDIPCLDYSKFVPYLIKVCQMQQAEIDELRNEINELKRRFE